MPKKLTAGERLKQYNKEFLKRVATLVTDFEYCDECNHPLSACGEQHNDGTPSIDCQVCKLRSLLADVRQQAIVVNEAVAEFYGDSVKYPQLKLDDYQQKQLQRIQAATRKLVKL
jgi:transcription elongation factor Elf1